MAATLARLHEQSDREDPLAVARMRAREAELRTKVYGRERAELYGGAPLAIKREVGELIHALTLARAPALAVEFGASVGLSTIYLAAALRDLGEGRLITTEIEPTKAERARASLAEAGLDDVVELRVGDAIETLRELPARVELLFLDGWNDLYLDVLEMVRPRLAHRSLIIADLSPDDPSLARYRRFVDASENGYLSVTIPLDAGVVISTWTGAT